MVKQQARAIPVGEQRLFPGLQSGFGLAERFQNQPEIDRGGLKPWPQPEHRTVGRDCFGLSAGPAVLDPEVEPGGEQVRMVRRLAGDPLLIQRNDGRRAGIGADAVDRPDDLCEGDCSEPAFHFAGGRTCCLQFSLVCPSLLYHPYLLSGRRHHTKVGLGGI
jgi:hypothetical protein